MNKVAAGDRHSLALMNTKGAHTWAWGYGDYGRLGNNSNESTSSPVLVAGGHKFVEIAVGDRHSLAIDNSGQAWAWGYGVYGQLGSDEWWISYPIVVASSDSFVKAAAGCYNSALIRSDGKAFTFGDNTGGQLGNNSTESSSSPVLVVGNHSFIDIAVGDDVLGSPGETFMLALKANGEVWAWGINNVGQLGNNDADPGLYNPYYGESSPVLVVGNHSFIDVTNNYWSSYALKANGEVWAWGLNDIGQLGDGTTTHKSSPVLVVGGHSFISISAGAYFIAALKANGEVWAWGDGDYGQLGNNNANPGGIYKETSPVLVVGNHSFESVSCGRDFVLAAKADGTVWSWGRNESGQLGDGTTTHRSSPVLVIGSFDPPPIAVSITESASASDSESTNVLLPVSITESASASDSESTNVTLPVSIEESAVAVSTESAIVTSYESFTHLFNYVTNYYSTTKSASIEEEVSAADGISAINIAIASVVEETATASDVSNGFMESIFVHLFNYSTPVELIPPVLASIVEDISADDSTEAIITEGQPPADMVKGPYLLYKGDNTKMTVMWQLDDTSEGVIEWGITTEYELGSQEVVESGSGSYEHQFIYDIESLTPGTFYYYRVFSGNAYYTGSFLTAPVTDGEFSFIFISDSHGNIESGIYMNKCYDTILDAINDGRANQGLLINGGDIRSQYQSESNLNDFFNRSLTRAIELQASIPLMLTRGNNDDVVLLRKYFPYDFAYSSNYYYAYDYGNARIIVIDFNVDYTSGSTQYNWIANELSTTLKKHKIIVLHSTPYHNKGVWPEYADMISDLVPLFEMYGVTMVFGGHSHFYCRCYVNGINYFTIAPTGGNRHSTGSSGTGEVILENGWTIGLVNVTNTGWTTRAMRSRDESIFTNQDYYQSIYDGTLIETVVYEEHEEEGSSSEESSANAIFSVSSEETCTATDTSDATVEAAFEASVEETCTATDTLEVSVIAQVSIVEYCTTVDLINASLDRDVLMFKVVGRGIGRGLSRKLL